LRHRTGYDKILLMNVRKSFLLIVLVLFCSGCIHFFGKSKVTADVEKPLVTSSKVFRLDDLQKGGTFAIYPFSAGVGVVSDQDLERLALHIVKSLSEELTKANGALQVYSVEDRGSADLVLKGRITQRVDRNKVVLVKKGYQSIAVEAKITKTDNQALVLQFSHKLKGADQDSWEAIGSQMGREIGRYLLNLSLKEK